MQKCSRGLPMSDKRTIVFGGTRGIGKAFAMLAAAAGEQVYVVSSKNSSEVFGDYAKITCCTCDIRDAASLAAFISSVPDWSNAVFFQRYRGPQGNDLTNEFETSVAATINAIDLLASHACLHKPHESRSIVVIGSLAARLDCCEQPVSYHVAKAAMEQLVRSYAVRLGGRGVRVNMVTPAIVLKDESAVFYLNNEFLMSLYKEIVPLQRMGTAHEVAKVVRFLCSDDASYVSGHNLVVDGGLSLQMQEGLARKVAQINRKTCDE